jgi:hypothetical protein
MTPLLTKDYGLDKNIKLQDNRFMLLTRRYSRLLTFVRDLATRAEDSLLDWGR